MNWLRTGLLMALLGVVLAPVGISDHKKGHDPGGGNGGADKVTICHFPGHEGDFEIGGKGPKETFCGKGGGQAIEIARTAAANGHGIEGKYL